MACSVTSAVEKIERKSIEPRRAFSSSEKDDLSRVGGGGATA